jgi:hypothetical protein
MLQFRVVDSIGGDYVGKDKTFCGLVRIWKHKDLHENFIWLPDLANKSVKDLNQIIGKNVI